MEEKNALLTEIRRQNRYLKSQLICIRILLILVILAAAGIGTAVYLGYPHLQNASETVKGLAQKAEEMMAQIQTTGSDADEIILHADEILTDLEPQIEELKSADLKTLVENLNDLSESINALNLEEFQKTMEDLQNTINAINLIANLAN